MQQANRISARKFASTKIQTLTAGTEMAQLEQAEAIVEQAKQDDEHVEHMSS